MKYAVLNESADSSIGPALIPILKGLVIQSQRDFPQLWESLPCEIAIYQKITDIPLDHNAFHIADTIPEAPGALAYHTVLPNGRPMLKLGWVTIQQNGGTLMTGANSLSSAMSHEICETCADPYCSFYSIWPADPTKMVCLECCDPVEGDSYDIPVDTGEKIAVSNFAGSRWFDQPDPGQAPIGPWDFMGTLSAPFTMSPGGYLAFNDGTQIYGDLMPQWKRDQKALYCRRKPKISPPSIAA
jgi:hypothetical protein